MVPGEPLIPERQVVVDGFLSLLANRGGFLEYRASLYDQLQKGDPVADVTDAFGTVRETIEAPEDSVFWSRALRPMVASGELVGTVGKNVRHI